MPDFAPVAKVSQLPTDAGTVVEVGGKTIALFRCDGQVYAIDNTCLHQGGPLGEGSVSGTCVTCPWHGWEYDLKTGACQLDASMRVQTFPVKLDGDNVLVALS